MTAYRGGGERPEIHVTGDQTPEPTALADATTTVLGSPGAVAPGASAPRTSRHGPGPANRAPAARVLRPGRFSTRRRLFLAFAMLGAAFVAAFAFQLAGLDRMKGALAEVQEHERQTMLALELESAVRNQFAHEAHFTAGESAHLAGYRDARARAEALLRELAASVDEPEAARLVGQIETATRDLDRLFQGEIAPAVLAGVPGGMLSHDRNYRHLFHVEETVDRLFGHLRQRSAALSGSVDEMRDATARLAVAFVVGTLLVAIALALHLSRSIARPLAEIGAGAHRFAAGDLGSRIDLAGDDEFGTLAAELNAMAATLKLDQEELVRSEKLASVGRVAAGIAHEINNPLQVMVGYLSLHRDRVDGELGRHLSRVDAEATRCKEIVESLLQLTRPAASFLPVPVDLREVADEVAADLRTSASAAIRVAGSGSALGTRCRFRQILFNLAKNAAEAVGPEGEVRIEVSGGEACTDVTVSDTGPGIPPALSDRVFEPFFTTKPDGTGLGLAIARGIAGALGGDLRLERGEPGGARFTLCVPRQEQGA